MKSCSRLLVLLGAVLFCQMSASAQVPQTSYRVEAVETPVGIAPEVSGIEFDSLGWLVACFRRGGLYRRDPATLNWSQFASGFQTPMGIVSGSTGEYFVSQLPELTRVVDTDGDGRGDLYQTIADQWGMSGNYHEFTYGLVRDRKGNFYIALGSASSGAPRLPVRGSLTKRGRKAKLPIAGTVAGVGHHSPVSYRGWVARITAAGRFIPIASGFRQPNGLTFNHEGELFVTDNQGDWVGTSPLHHVTEGAFYGHPGSLNWHPDFLDVDPVDIEIEVLSRRRKLPAIQFPQNDMAGSLGQPLEDATGGKFGPYGGQMFVVDWTYPRIHRAYMEKVRGEYQGACFPFIEGHGLRKGGIRLAFSPDGALYVAQTSRIWGAGEGLQRIVWTGTTPMDIREMRLTRSGFDLVFTKAVDPRTAADSSDYSMIHYYYRYHADYGSPKTDVTLVSIKKVSVSRDGYRVSLHVNSLVAGRVYELRPGKGIRSKDGDPLVTRLAAYTLNHLRR